MNERQERILTLVDNAVGKIGALTEPEPMRQAYDELYVAAIWIRDLDPSETDLITRAIFEEPERGYHWARFLVLAVGNLDRQIDTMNDGAPYEYEGTMMQVVDSATLDALVKAQKAKRS